VDPGVNEHAQGSQMTGMGELTIAVTTSGEAKKFIVFLLPSFLPPKLRLNDVKMAL
jgi:ribonuclease PH